MGVYRYFLLENGGYLETYNDKNGYEYRWKANEHRSTTRYKRMCSGVQAAKAISRKIKECGLEGVKELVKKDVECSPFPLSKPPKPSIRRPNVPIKPKSEIVKWKNYKTVANKTLKEILDEVGDTDLDHWKIVSGRSGYYSISSSIKLKKKVVSPDPEFSKKQEQYEKRRQEYEKRYSNYLKQQEKYKQQLKEYEERRSIQEKVRDIIDFEVQKAKITNKYGEKELKKVVRSR